MLFSSHLKHMALVIALSSCFVSSYVLASGDPISALGEDVAERAISPSARPRASAKELSGPSPLASIFCSADHREIFKIVASHFDWKSLFQLRGVRRDFQSQMAVLGQNPTPEEIQKAKQALFVAIICKDYRSPTDIPESLKETLSWSNLVLFEGALKPTDFKTLSVGLRMLSLKSHTIWSDLAMVSLQTWLGHTTRLESLNLPYCGIGPTVYGISQYAAKQQPTEAAAFVSYLPLTLRHLDLSGDKNMGGHEIVNSLLKSFYQSPLQLASLSLKGRSVIHPGALPSSLTSLSIDVPFYMSAETIKPLQLPKDLEELCLTSDVFLNIKDVLKYIPKANVIKRLTLPLKNENNVSCLFGELQTDPSLAKIRVLGFGFNILEDKAVELALSTLGATQLVSINLKECCSLSGAYKNKLRSSLFHNRNGEEVEIKL